MADAPIEELQIAVEASANGAVSGIEALQASLEKMRSAAKGGLGLGSVTKGIRGLGEASKAIDGQTVSNLERLASTLSVLSKLKGLTISSTIAKQLGEISSATKGMQGMSTAPIGQLTGALTSLTSVGKGNLGSQLSQLKKVPEIMRNLAGVDFAKANHNIQELVASLYPLISLGKSNLGSILSQLKKLPDVLKSLGDLDMGLFASKIQQVTAALAPLASQMSQVAAGFSAFPAKIQKLISATNQMPTAVSRASGSWLGFGFRLGAVYFLLRRSGSAIAGWVNESNQYIENLNLFTVSMGEFADEAGQYAEKVSEVMGIDPGEWMRNQGVFQTLATGFGVAGDRAYIMSKNLTQLGYDLSSFFNLSTAESFQKLQSGLAGELEPLRRLGFDLSKARLEQEALNLGITKNYAVMTQAEKAQLRYVAIMSQVTTAQGDMARTLEAPANQLRILKSQVVMAARSLGNIFIPVLNKVLPYVIAVTKVIRVLADTIGRLVGFKLPDIDYGSTKPMGDIADSAEDIESGLGGAVQHAKELRTQMMGIDELNVLHQPMPDYGTGSGGLGKPDIGGGEFDFELPEYDFLKDTVSTKVDEIVRKMREWLGITEEIDSWSELFQTRLGHILLLAGVIGVTLLGWKVTQGLVNTINAIKALGSIGQIVIGVALTITGLTLEWSGLRDSILNGLNKENFTEIITGALLTLIGGAITGAAIAVTAGGAALGGALIGGILAGIIGGAGALFGGIWDVIHNGLTEMNASLILLGSTLIGAAIGALFGPVGAGIGALIGLTAGLVANFEAWLFEKVTGLGTWFEENWGNATEWISEKWSNFKGWISEKWSWIKGKFKELVDNILLKLEPITTRFKAFYNSPLVQNIISKIKTTVQPIVSWFETNIKTPLTGKFNEIKNAISNAFQTAYQNIQSIFGPLYNWFMNTIVNPIMNALNQLRSKMNIGGGIGLTTGGIFQAHNRNQSQGWYPGNANMPDIPRADKGETELTVHVDYHDQPWYNRSGWSGKFAEGGFPSTGQVFLAREAGPEMVGKIGGKTAVVNNEQIVEGVSNGVEVANIGVINAIEILTEVMQNKNFSVSIGDSDIGEANERYMDARGDVLSSVWHL